MPTKALHRYQIDLAATLTETVFCLLLGRTPRPNLFNQSLDGRLGIAAVAGEEAEDGSIQPFDQPAIG